MNECRFIVYEGDAKRRAFCLTHRSEEGVEAVVHLAALCSVGKADLEARLASHPAWGELYGLREVVNNLEAALAAAERAVVSRLYRVDDGVSLIECENCNDTEAALAEERAIPRCHENCMGYPAEGAAQWVRAERVLALPKGMKSCGEQDVNEVFIRFQTHKQATNFADMIRAALEE